MIKCFNKCEINYFSWCCTKVFSEVCESVVLWCSWIKLFLKVLCTLCKHDLKHKNLMIPRREAKILHVLYIYIYNKGSASTTISFLYCIYIIVYLWHLSSHSPSGFGSLLPTKIYKFLLKQCSFKQTKQIDIFSLIRLEVYFISFTEG